MRRKNGLLIAVCTIACITTSGVRKPVENYPATVLNLINWKLNTPLDEDKNGTSDEIKQPKLATYTIDPWFHNNENNTGVVFRANCGGITTSGSGFPQANCVK